MRKQSGTEKRSQKTRNEPNRYKKPKGPAQPTYTLTTMSDIYNIKNWSDAHLKEDDNDSDELADAKHVERKRCAKARREEEDWRKVEAEAARKAAEEVKRKVEEEERRKAAEAAAEEEAKKWVSNLLPRATAS